jgi:hypothetical protein
MGKGTDSSHRTLTRVTRDRHTAVSRQPVTNPIHRLVGCQGVGAGQWVIGNTGGWLYEDPLDWTIGHLCCSQGLRRQRQWNGLP